MDNYLKIHNDNEKRNKLRENDDNYTLAMMVLLLLKSNNPERYANLVDLFYLLDEDTFIKVLQVFGGTTINVPTEEEFDQLMKGIILYQRSNVDKEDPRQVKKDLGLSKRVGLSSTYTDESRVIDEIASTLDDLLNDPSVDIKLVREGGKNWNAKRKRISKSR